MKLFEDDWGVDQSEKDDTEITTTILYFSREELREVKKLCKVVMKKADPVNYAKTQNISDTFLTLLRKEVNGKNSTTSQDGK